MIQKRLSHAAGIVTDEASQGKLVIVTGGWGGNVGLKSSEILIGDIWVLGKKRTSSPL